MPDTIIGKVPEDWEISTLGELCASGGGDIQTGPFGSQLHASDYVSAGIPSVMPQNIGDNVILPQGIARITSEDASRLSRYLLRAGDIVYSRRGDVERRAWVREEEVGWLCGTGCLRVRLGESADSRFMSYYLGHPDIRAWIVQHAIGATMPNLNTGILSAVPVAIPSRSAQRSISALLGAIDDKVAVNQRITVASRALALTYFHSIVESEKSEELQIGTLVTSLNRGIAPRYTDDPLQLHVLNQKCIRDGRANLGPARRTIADKVPSQKLLERHDVLVNSTGVGTLGRVARWTERIPATVDSHVTIVRFDPAKVDPVCAGLAMLSAEHEIEALGEGSTGQTELSRARLSALEITVPSRSRSEKLRPILEALEGRGDQALEESLSLTELRDTLLPKLMSGEIRMWDAEKIVEDVT
jgi:type I restriction enzyme, S subunit